MNDPLLFLASPLGFAVLAVGMIAALSVVRRPAVGLALIVFVSVAVERGTLNWPLVAGVTSVFIVTLVLAVLNEKQRAWAGEPTRIRTPVDGLFVAFAAIAVVYLVVGLVRGNDLTYALGDFYHVMFELVAPFFLFTIFIKSSSRVAQFNRGLTTLMLVLSAAILILYFTGAIQYLEGGGVRYRRSEFWRLHVSHNYPLIPLLWITALWLFASGKRAMRETGIATVLLIVALVVTLKRAAWLSAAAVYALYFTQVGLRERVKAFGWIVGLAILAMVSAMIVIPEEAFRATAGLEQYGKAIGTRFSADQSDVDESLGNRFSELAYALDIIMSNPFGHGLGSEFEVQRRSGQALETRHYIHNVYIHYSLQVGIGYVILVVILSLKVFGKGFYLLRHLPRGPLKATVLGAVGSLAAILTTSMTELAIHTFFIPYSAAMVFVAEELARREGLIGATQEHLDASQGVRSG